MAEAAAELEGLGYSALWICDRSRHRGGGDVFEAVARLAAATTGVAVGTSILNLWMHAPEAVSREWAALSSAAPGRLALGIGCSHAPLIDAIEPGRFQKPFQATVDYLDALDTAEVAVPAAGRMLAALRPRMLQLAAERTGGAVPYHQPPEHTARAREVMGPGTLLAPEQPVLLETDRATARDAARAHLRLYFGLPNYLNAWRWLGFTDDDFAGGGSDRLVDALVAWGDEDAIVRRVGAHRDAGADHVCVQVVADDLAGARRTLRTLAPALGS